MVREDVQEEVGCLCCLTWWLAKWGICIPVGAPSHHENFCVDIPTTWLHSLNGLRNSVHIFVDACISFSTGPLLSWHAVPLNCMCMVALRIAMRLNHITTLRIPNQDLYSFLIHYIPGSLWRFSRYFLALSGWSLEWPPTYASTTSDCEGSLKIWKSINQP